MIWIISITVVIATILGSISGIGGGVLIKPVMDAVCNLTSSQISFMSGTTVLVMTVSSLIRSRKQLKVKKTTLLLAVGAAVGGLTGKAMFELVKAVTNNDEVVGLVQNIVMVLMVVTVFIYTVKKDNVKTVKIENSVVSALVGVLMGIVSSFLGIGGGPINIMILSYFFSMDTKTAALNSLFVIFFSQMFSFVSSCVKRNIPNLDLNVLFLMMVLAVVGSLVGRKLSSKMDNKKVDRLFMCLMVIIILISVYNCFKFAL